MRLPLSWIKSYLPLEQSPEKIGQVLTMAGLEVEAIEHKKPQFEGIIVGEVLEVTEHPKADKLKLAKVSTGSDVVNLVCGAKNCRAGMLTAMAPVGAKLFTDGKSVTIRRAKIRGEESFGMLCSSKELHLSENDHEGIIDLTDKGYVVGASLDAIYEEILFEIALTPNLGHCFSLFGVLRELSAALHISFNSEITQKDTFPLQEIKKRAKDVLKVEIQQKDKCLSYGARVIEGVRVKESPDWLKNRLQACGVRPINVIVDVTNYVMLEQGHPMHAFDKEQLSGNTIYVRSANNGERIETLDRKNYELSEHDLVIADDKRVQAIAGVMGGSFSEVTFETTQVVLEAAYFSKDSVRKTAKKYQISTESSKRFERGVDIEIIEKVLDRAASLMIALAGGQVLEGAVIAKGSEYKKKYVSCRLSRINALLGTKLSVSEVEEIFERLYLPYTRDRGTTFNVTIPSYRHDLNIEEDLIEEVARTFGYNNLPLTQVKCVASLLPDSPLYGFERNLRSVLMGQGLTEMLNCDLIGPKIQNIVGGPVMHNASAVHVMNPTSIEQSVLRTSLLPGFLQVVKHNYDHSEKNICGFEIGRVHFKEDHGYKEQSVVGMIFTGKAMMQSFDRPDNNIDFFDAKGVLENLLRSQGITQYEFVKSFHPFLHPGRQANLIVEGQDVGAIGQVHPDCVDKLDVDQEIFYAEVNAHDLYPYVRKKAHMESIPQYPTSTRDITFSLPENIPLNVVLKEIDVMKEPLLESVSLKDIYTGEGVKEGERSVTLHFVYRDLDKTIEQEQVDAVHGRIFQKSLYLARS